MLAVRRGMTELLASYTAKNRYSGTNHGKTRAVSAVGEFKPEVLEEVAMSVVARSQ
jgi:hypothetical protein